MPYTVVDDQDGGFVSCDFTQPRRVGSWNGLEVQIRKYGDKNVLVTAIPNSATDKHYPRGDNFWDSFSKDAGADALRACLNAGSTGWGGLAAPANLATPAGYRSGNESDGAFFFEQSSGGGSCDFNISASTVGANCNQQVTLSATCGGANCDGISYTWSGNNLNQNGQSVTFSAPGSNGNYYYTVTAARSGCSRKTATGTVNVNGCGGGSTSPLVVGCYTIKSQKTGQSLQAMDDGTIKQQGGNGQSNQIWKAEDAGNGQFRFTTQKGSNQVIKTNSGTNYGEQLSLGDYTGDDRQKWSVQQDGATGSYRVYRSDAITWDLNNYGNNPELQLWGTTAESFVDYRQFRFESTGCGGTTPPSSGGSCQESESITDQGGSVISGGNASGGQYRGSYGNQFEGLTYALNVPSAGTYTLKLSYATADNPTAGVIVNGGGVQNLPLTSTGNWNAFAEKSLTVSLNAGNNSIRVQGGPGGSFNQDKLCAVSGSGSRIGVSLEESEASPLLIAPNPSKGSVTVRFRLKPGEAATLSAVTTRGQLLQQQAVVGTGDEQTEHIDLSRERAGMYLIRLQTDGKSQVGKLILER